jgi:hypothetical protein
MRTLKVLALVLALSLPAWGLTNNGVSAPLQGVSVANTDCPAALANSSGGLGGTNGKAVAIQLPNWAASVDVDIGGTFVGTWAITGSTDGLAFRNIAGPSVTNRFNTQGGTGSAGVTVSDVAMRFVCVSLTAYTSGSVVAVIEPRAGAITNYIALPTGSSISGLLTAGTSSSSAQGAQATSSIGAMTVPVADKSVVHQPAAATVASASVVGIGGRHIGTTCTVYISTVAAQPDIVVNLRDGAAGAGTVLWTGRVTCSISSGDTCKVQSPPLNAIGTASTAMTCETATAPAAGNLATATLTYHDAG